MAVALPITRTVAWALILFGCVFRAVPILAQPDGKELYTDACASCHGHDGRGSPEGSSIDVPVADFSDCQIATREPDPDWIALTAHGGPVLGLSNRMPSFAQVLSADEMKAVLDYIRAFCTNPAWPRGELNFRRPSFVTKAFPEDEAVLVQRFSDATSNRTYSTELAVERRVGARGQVELTLPLSIVDAKDGATTAGVGDIALAYKHVAYASLQTRSIVALAADLVVPSGDHRRGLGDGTTIFEPALLSGHTYAGVVLQTQFRAVLPVDVNRAARHFLYRFALQYPLGTLKNALVPALEFESAQKIDGSFRDYTLLAPTLYVPLTKRGHVAVGLGTQIPVSQQRPFDYRVGAFFLWEYLDGGIWW